VDPLVELVEVDPVDEDPLPAAPLDIFEAPPL
jgi:hypothetical protein